MVKTLVGCLALCALAAGCVTGPVSAKDKKVTVVERENLPGTFTPISKTYFCDPEVRTRTRSGGICITREQRVMEKDMAHGAGRRAGQKAAASADREHQEHR